jgi:hypothetical protein
MAKSYWDLLRDPRWQRMRLEIMQRDNFTCQRCNRNDLTLNVHHSYYVTGRAPWEYEPESLRTLCEECHETIEAELAELRRRIGLLDDRSRMVALGYLRSLGHESPIDITNESVADGVADAFGLTRCRVDRVARPVFNDDPVIGDRVVVERSALRGERLRLAKGGA